MMVPVSLLEILSAEGEGQTESHSEKRAGLSLHSNEEPSSGGARKTQGASSKHSQLLIGHNAGTTDTFQCTGGRVLLLCFIQLRLRAYVPSSSERS